MTSDAQAAIRSLWKSVNSISEEFKQIGTYLSSIRIDYDCCGGACDTVCSYIACKNIIRNHEVVRIVSENIANLPAHIESHESAIRGMLIQLLVCVHGDGLAHEGGCGGYLLFHPSSTLVTGEHIQAEIDEDDDGQYHPECKQAYVFSVKADQFEDDREIIDIQFTLE